MAARTETGQISREPLRGLLIDWSKNRHSVDVKLEENLDPENDPNADYVVDYEAVFEPSSLEYARMEIWSTTDECIAVGIETRHRIAMRLGLRYRGRRFAAGHEPLAVSEKGLVALLESVANGEIKISATVLPWVGLVHTQAIINHKALGHLVSSGYPSLRWIKEKSDTEVGRFHQIITFKPW